MSKFTNSKVVITRKSFAPVTTINVTNYIAFTNSADAHFELVYDCIDNNGKDIYTYLDRRDISEPFKRQRTR